jgi:LytS/YehU family sensor histidine kinase
LLQEKISSQLNLLNKDNLIKEQELQRAALVSKEKEQQVRLLDQANQIKNNQLQKKDFARNVLLAGLAITLFAGFFITRSFRLKRKNDKLEKQSLNNELKMQKLASQAKQAEMQQQARELEMKALHAQMNPHFIFNSLSSINCFILENNTEAASDYLTKFSRLIRMVLINSQKTMITLEEDLKMLQLYLDMERLRFENAFEYSIDIDKKISLSKMYVPPLLLQPFCENSIWHGFWHVLMHKQGSKMLAIKIGEDENFLYCTITDNGIGRKEANTRKNCSKPYKSMGLQLSSDRLALINTKYQLEAILNIEDIMGEKGNILGTRVNIRMEKSNLLNETLTANDAGYYN